MFTVFEPSETQIVNFLAAQRDLSFSYPEVGASKNKIPSGYPINHHRIQIGSGAEAFARAKNAIQNWTMYRLEWTRLYPDNAPIAVGGIVCVVVNHRFCRSINFRRSKLRGIEFGIFIFLISVASYGELNL